MDPKSEVPSAAPIAKITTHEEMTVVCRELKGLGENPATAKVAHKNELKLKIENYMRNMLVELTSKKKKKKDG